MGVKSIAGKVWAEFRVKQIRKNHANSLKVQSTLLQHLLESGKKTKFGVDHQFETIKNESDFKLHVPVRTYEAYKPYINEILAGKRDVLWPGKPAYLAKSSGTTSGAKYIPLTKESVPFHIAGARDALFFHIMRSSKASFLNGKMMFLSGSPELENHPSGIPLGRLSGIVNHYVPAYLQRNKCPDYATNCIEDWEEKVTAIAKLAIRQDLRLISGIPPWVLMLFDKVKELTGKSPSQIWPNLELYVHGGVDFNSYKELFLEALGKKIDYAEVYPASEGFIAIQDEGPEDGLLLIPEYGIYYEFIPMTDYGQEYAPRLSLNEVKVGVQYAIILTTNAGLWAYDIGDTIKFVSLNPWRIQVTGRTSRFISAFGEHVIEEEVNQAMLAACSATGARIVEFTVMPFISEKESCHEWYVEFNVLPSDLKVFAAILDVEMQKKNIYYKDLVQGQVLRPLEVIPLNAGASNAIMKDLGKLGGQNKFPRLSNNRSLAESILKLDLRAI